MKKITFKILNTLAKQHNTTLCEIFSVFLGNIVNGNLNFESVVSKIFKNLSLKEKEILNNFFNYLQNDLFKEREEFVNNFIFDEDCEVAFSLFFATFLSDKALFSKNPDKIREDLKKYPSEIQEAILKSLEMLSLAKKVKEKDILKEVLNTMILLSEIFKVLRIENDSK